MSSLPTDLSKEYKHGARGMHGHGTAVSARGCGPYRRLSAYILSSGRATSEYSAMAAHIKGLIVIHGTQDLLWTVQPGSYMLSAGCTNRAPAASGKPRRHQAAQ